MASVYIEYLGWQAKTSAEWLKFSTANTFGDKAQYVTLSKTKRVLTVSSDGGPEVEGFEILFDADPNDRPTVRTATITITQEGNTNVANVKHVTIRQEANSIESSMYRSVGEYEILTNDSGVTYTLQTDIVVPYTPEVGPVNPRRSGGAAEAPVYDGEASLNTIEMTANSGAVYARISCEVKYITWMKFQYSNGLSYEGYFGYKGEVDENNKPIWYEVEQITSDETDAVSYEFGDVVTEENTIDGINNARPSTNPTSGPTLLSSISGKTPVYFQNAIKWSVPVGNNFVTASTTTGSACTFTYGVNTELAPNENSFVGRTFAIIGKGLNGVGKTNGKVFQQPANQYIGSLSGTLTLRSESAETCGDRIWYDWSVTRNIKYPSATMSSNTRTSASYSDISQNCSPYGRMVTINKNVNAFGATTTLSGQVEQYGVELPEDLPEFDDVKFERYDEKFYFNNVLLPSNVLPYSSGTLSYEYTVKVTYTWHACDETCLLTFTGETSTVCDFEIDENDTGNDRILTFNEIPCETEILVDYLGTGQQTTFYGGEGVIVEPLTVIQEGIIHNYELSVTPDNLQFDPGNAEHSQGLTITSEIVEVD